MSAAKLQRAIYDHLSADAALSALIVGIYDNPQQVADPSDNSEFPFLTISEGTAGPWDTDTEQGHDALIDVHTWSRAQHALEAKEILDAVIASLHRATISITDHVSIGCDYSSRTVLRDPDGITRHGVAEFRIVYEEA